MFQIKTVDLNETEVWRVFISGSSSAGKTYFAKQMLKAEFFKFERIVYFHPDLQESFPTDWKNDFTIPVIYQAGLPTENELLKLQKNSVLVFDDVFTMACESKLIDYLFRVLSSKKKLHCIIMTQRYFAGGSNGLNIRNSSNFHVLMNNADERTNTRVANTMNLRREVDLAIQCNKTKLYPYIFIDRTNHARVSGIQIYIDIFSTYRKAIYNQMICYIVKEPDFLSHFDIVEGDIAVKNGEYQKKNISASSRKDSPKIETSQPTSSDIDRPEESKEKRAVDRTVFRTRFHNRKKFERAVQRSLHRYHVKTQLYR